MIKNDGLRKPLFGNDNNWFWFLMATKISGWINEEYKIFT